jgi:hypothetical protein
MARRRSSFDSLTAYGYSENRTNRALNRGGNQLRKGS